MRQVERQALLAGVQVGEAQAALQVRPVVGERTDPADRIAAGRLDLDHLHAQVTQHLAAELAAQVGQVERGIAFEQQHRFSSTERDFPTWCGSATHTTYSGYRKRL